MAKIINLTLEGVQVYPQTITDAIADIDSKKKLSTILKELKSEQAKKYKLLRDAAKPLTYHLFDGDGVDCGTIDIPQDTFLDSVTLENDALKIMNLSSLSIPQAIKSLLRSIFQSLSTLIRLVTVSLLTTRYSL